MTTSSSSSTSLPNRQAELVQLLAGHTESTPHPTAEELQTYVETQLAGLPYQTVYADFAHHLDACVACAEAYGRLYELIFAEQQEILVAPAQIPEADLTFLRPSTHPTWLEQIQTAIDLVGQRLTLQLRPDLLPGLQPLVDGGLLRAPSDDERYHEQILELHEDDLPVALAVYRDSHQPDQCLVEITIAPPDRSWPDLGDIVVTIHGMGETRSTTTDAWGLAIFANVPISQIAEMQIEAAL